MAGLCKAVLIGHLGKDPEVRYTPDGLAVASFSLAATEKVKGQDRTEWFRITAFGKLGEVCGQFLSKGKQVYIEGRLQSNEWTDQEGNKRFSLEVIANLMQMLGTKGDQDAAPASRPASRPATRSDDDMPPSPIPGPPTGGADADEDIPF